MPGSVPSCLMSISIENKDWLIGSASLSVVFEIRTVIQDRPLQPGNEYMTSRCPMTHPEHLWFYTTVKSLDLHLDLLVFGVAY